MKNIHTANFLFSFPTFHFNNNVMKKHLNSIDAKHKSKKIFTTLLLFFIFWMMSLNANAATRNWIGRGSAGGGTGTDFNTTANWDGSGALLSTDDLVITYTKNNITTISLSASVTVKSLTVNVTTATSNADKTCTIAIGNYTLTTTGNVSYTNAQTGISYIFTLNTQ